MHDKPTTPVTYVDDGSKNMKKTFGQQYHTSLMCSFNLNTTQVYNF